MEVLLLVGYFRENKIVSWTVQAAKEALSQAQAQALSTSLGASALLGFDTETTGISLSKDAICSATLVLKWPNTTWDSYGVIPWIINPHQAVHPEASKVNGFTDEYLQEHGVEPVQALEEIASIITLAQQKHIPLLAYNAPFDVHMLEQNLTRWGLPTIQERLAQSSDELLVVDPLVIDRAISNREGRRTLTATTYYYGVVPHGDFHDATADTIAAVDLMEPITRLYPQINELPLQQLMSWQRQAHETQQASYAQWAEQHGRSVRRTSWL